MTRLLVSVRDIGEARTAAAHGAHLIDLKEPVRGALGAVDPAHWVAIRGALPAGVPLSAALGELLDPAPVPLGPEAGAIQFAKIGLAGCGCRPDWTEIWRQAWQRLPPQVERVAVVYADYPLVAAPSPAEVVSCAAAAGCRMLLVDTATKDGRTLFDHLPPARLRELMEQARQQGLGIVLAGSLRLAQLEELRPLQPDYVAVRGAVCWPDRRGTLAGQRVAEWVARLAALQPAPPATDDVWSDPSWRLTS